MHVCNRICFILLALCSTGVYAADPNVLREPDSKLVSEDLNARQLSMAARLTDGITNIPVLGPKDTISLVFEYPDIVSPDQVVIHLSAVAEEGLVGEVELMSSLVSPNAGFQLLRAAAVSANKKKLTLKFKPVGSRWLLIRYTPAQEPTKTGISEIEVLGQKGAPVSAYEFKESPVAALQVLEQLENAVTVNISDAEKQLFDDAADGRLDTWSLAEAALLASDVTDDAQRAALVRQIDTLEQSFREQLRPGLTPLDTGHDLLNWLHLNAFQAGYVSQQTDVSTVLSDRTFNCVSSAVLYSILATRLGLDVRGIEVPDHAFAILYDGSEYADIETTTKQGFNPSRNRQALEAFESTTGFSYIPDRRPDKRREITPLALISFIYYNHGVALSDESRHHEALLAYFRALSLDPESALDIVQLGLSLAPEDRTLNYNHRVLWQQRINLAADQLEIEAFMALIDQAQVALPAAGFESQQALYFIKRSESLVEQAQWRAAVTEVSAALPRMNEASKKELGRYQLNLILRWSNSEIVAQQWEDALDVLAWGLELLPGNRRISGNIAYVLQEWSEVVFAESGEEAAEAVVNQVAERFPDIKGVRRASRSYAIRRIEELNDTAQYAEALELIHEYQHLIGSDRDFDTLIRSVYDAQAEVYLQASNWEAALAVYAQAQAAFPDNKQIKRNHEATWHQWARTYMDDSRWSEAAEVYELGLQSLPDERSFKQNINFIIQEWLKALDASDVATQETITAMYDRFGELQDISPAVKTFYMRSVSQLQEAGEFEASVSLAREAQSVVLDEDEAIDVLHHAYDQWAGNLADEKEWLAATEIYQQSLEVLPDDRHLKNNAIATWHQWAETFMDQEDWGGAIEIYQMGLERIPDARLFERNIRYCEQQISRQ
jgi:tetratricopeptide (TPR) repeat protein